MPTPIDTYLTDHPRWQPEMTFLRQIALTCGLSEAVKWRKPCFTHNDANIAILQPFAHECRLMFFNGALLPDPDNLLTSQGAETQSALVLRFTDTAQIAAQEPAIRALFAAAIRVAVSGQTVPRMDIADRELPPELLDALDGDPALATAWAALTPGRQRSHILHIQSAKQSGTRTARVDKARPDIRSGRGWNER